MSILRKIIA